MKSLNSQLLAQFSDYDLLRIKALSLKDKMISEFAWTEQLFDHYRYKILIGGRGSGKSFEVAESFLLISCMRKNCLILCGREYQNSIKDSVHSLLRQRIEALGLSEYFEVTYDEIRNVYTQSRLIFKGLRHNIDSIKSTAGITHLWIEEANTLSANSWRVIKPTVRENNSEIWATFNPKSRIDVLYDEFISNTAPSSSYIAKVNWYDNPYFPDVLREQMEYDRKRDLGLFKHIWEGECLEHSDSQVFKNKWVVQKFTEDEKAYKYFGLDFGFSQDPTAGIRCYIRDNVLYITHEAVSTGVEIDKIGEFLEYSLPDIKTNPIHADSSRPESISLIARQGYNIRAVEKGKGSVEDGIEYIKSFEMIIIHPSCKHTIDEFNLYSYKIDERSEEITNRIIDKHNHCIDALRYALERCMKRAKTAKSSKNGYNKVVIF